jgi:hypothetical protein
VFAARNILFISVVVPEKMFGNHCSWELRPLTGPLSIPYDTWVNMKQRCSDIDRGKQELGGKPVSVPLCPPQVPHGLTRARTRASVVTNRLSYQGEDIKIISSSREQLVQEGYLAAVPRHGLSAKRDHCVGWKEEDDFVSYPFTRQMFLLYWEGSEYGFCGELEPQETLH